MVETHFKELGKRLRTDEVAMMLNLDRKTVIKHYLELGGLKLGRRIMFFENLIVRALERGASYALPEEGQDLDRAGYAERTPEGTSRISEQEGCGHLGERAKKTSIKR